LSFFVCPADGSSLFEAAVFLVFALVWCALLFAGIRGVVRFGFALASAICLWYGCVAPVRGGA
jgi:hypothetical protein